MQKVFSPTAQQVFIVGHHAVIPADALPMTLEDERRYVGERPPGMIVEVGASGAWRHAPAPVIHRTLEECRMMIEAQRLRAYADPLTGSDRYFAEAQRESLLGNSEAAEVAKALGLARFAEIQAEYPWPAE